MRTIRCRGLAFGLVTWIAVLGALGCSEGVDRSAAKAAPTPRAVAGLPPLQAVPQPKATPVPAKAAMRSPTSFVVDLATVSRVSGYAYQLEPPDEWLPFASDQSDPERSTLVIEEDGAPLGPGNVPLETVKTVGRGSFLHWGSWIYFSSSDNTDPRSNGREYRVLLKPAG